MRKIIVMSLLTLLVLPTVLAASSYSNGYSWDKRVNMKTLMCRCDVTRGGLISQQDYDLVNLHLGKKIRDYPYLENLDVDMSGRIGLRDLKLIEKYNNFGVWQIC